MKALAIACGIVFWTLVLGTTYLAFFPGGGAEPVTILQIEPATAPGGPDEAAGVPQMPEAAPAPAGEAAPAEPAPAEGNMDLPPGFAVGPPEAPQAPPVGQQGLPMTPEGQGGAPAAPPAPDDAAPPETPDQQGAAPEAPAMQQAALDAPAGATPPPPPPPPEPENETGSIALASVPAPELVEQSQYGPLPKIAADGRRAIDVYSRPSRYAVANPSAPPRVAILMTGLGLPDGPPKTVLEGLPAQVSIAYGAYGRSLQDAVAAARADGHEVLLQIPLEPENYPTVDPGPHTLLTTLPPADNVKRLQWLMSRYAGYVGVTSHMGDKFQASAESIQPVFEELKRRGLLYVDSEGAQDSATAKVASAIGLDYFVVNIQIDAGDPAQQLAKLEQVAKERGAAIGVVRAKPATAKQISDWAAKLEGKGIVLVPVSAAVRSQAQS
ncbi:MAG TPA: divergent polysaccharide deacetylase family protein [Methyloceanibacter sp.]|nr:divergent polysaccharide deacetylase family protein [Methyloceanibacter sp.]